MERCILTVTKVCFVTHRILCLATMLNSFVCLTCLIRLIDPHVLTDDDDGDDEVWVAFHDFCARHSALYEGEACWFKLETSDTGELLSVHCMNSANVLVGVQSRTVCMCGGIHVHSVSSVCTILYLYTCTLTETLVCKRMYHKLQFSEIICGLFGSWILQPTMLLYHRNAGMQACTRTDMNANTNGTQTCCHSYTNPNPKFVHTLRLTLYVSWIHRHPSVDVPPILEVIPNPIIPNLSTTVEH